MMKFIYIFFFTFLIITIGVLLFIPLFIIILSMVINNLSDINWLFSKEAWAFFYKGLMKEMSLAIPLSIAIGIISSTGTVAIYLCDRSIVPDLRTRCIGLGILAVFMASLFFLAKYYGLIPLKNAFA